ncbi:uncharacterized protein PGTG_21169 [Puccinia graminis f. sp. tritici CRL 75-36-700-3]|uniref:Uncharacterized protein n=1 Tax=Puccinia graminis f. sp. tritici (strain CRL 75-36-700-3 / race SCCL) TaxID=418459 RepID=H6QQK9_PUCGT|nr:uncharacterized protein PGTG_21169 [Puccinia graminis f. sp. tritici CRL 75-36-700-3]EHS62661.1 hypothetical protein PGTG_21169 [Puccinia graminis f. sp. tritici CRL 75-36-700-3]
MCRPSIAKLPTRLSLAVVRIDLEARKIISLERPHGPVAQSAVSERNTPRYRLQRGVKCELP